MVYYKCASPLIFHETFISDLKKWPKLPKLQFLPNMVIWRPFVRQLIPYKLYDRRPINYTRPFVTILGQTDTNVPSIHNTSFCMTHCLIYCLFSLWHFFYETYILMDVCYSERLLLFLPPQGKGLFNYPSESHLTDNSDILAWQFWNYLKHLMVQDYSLK